MCPVVCAHLSVLPVQMEQQNNGIDVDQDADLAYNSLKVSKAGCSLLVDGCRSWTSGDRVLSSSLLISRVISK